jgi:hypothetical protein
MPDFTPGRTNRTTQHVHPNYQNPMNPDLIVYEFSREKVAAGDCSHLLAQFDVSRQEPSLLKRGFGRVVFTFSGYDDHRDELHSIPEVRRFLRLLRARWPYLLFFGALHDDSLKAIYLGYLDSLEAAQIKNACQVRFDYDELTKLIAADLWHADSLCEKLGVSQATRLRRATEVLRYFGVEVGT